MGSANTQQVLNKNNEAWNSFFSLLAEEKRKIASSHESRFATKLLEE